ncbi:MAG: transglycosylase SLT domain-containing protein [Synergistota bacterium]|nr:transglycosylase SLT domain-containing protein [Synergistota bacterium]
MRKSCAYLVAALLLFVLFLSSPAAGAWSMGDLFFARDWRGVDSLLRSGVDLTPMEKSLAANALWFSNRFEEALALFEECALHWPDEVRPYGEFMMVLALERLGRPGEAVAKALDLLPVAPSDLGYYAAYALFRLADASDGGERREAAQKMYSLAQNDSQRTTALAELLKLPGDKTEYALRMTDMSPRNSAALKVLESLPKPWSSDVNMAVGYAAYLSGKYDKAIPLFLAIPMDSRHGRKSRYYRAFCLYNKKQYAPALEAWGYLAKTGESYAESSVRRISILAGRGERENALRVLREVASNREGEIQVRAYYSLSTHLSGKEKAAAEDKVIELAPGSLFTTQILWGRGWDRWRAGDVAGATAQWEKSLAPGMNRNWRPRVIHWVAKGHERLGNREKSRLLLDGLKKDHPLSIYAFMAGGEIELTPGTPPDLDSEPSLLEQWGFVSHARRVLLAKGDERSVFRAARLADWTGDQQATYTAALKIGERLRTGPFYEDALSMLYPRPFYSDVTRAAERFEVEDNLVWAIMKQESAFNPAATSWAGAGGLMQLMPGTAAGEAKSLGMKEYSVYDAEQNIIMGTAHIARLMRSFGDVGLSLAAYNAGPGNARKWLGDRKDVPLDEWIELVRFEETNDYVQKVTANLEVYRALYPPEEEEVDVGGETSDYEDDGD